MNACDAYAEALLDERLPRPPGLEAHLSGCAKCRALGAGHAAAKALTGVLPPDARRVPRRAVVTRLALVAAVGVALGAGALVARPSRPLEVARPTRNDARGSAPTREGVEVAVNAPGEGSLSRVAEPSLAALRVTSDGWQELAELAAFTARATRTNPSADSLYAGRAPVASYLSMARQDPMAGLGFAVSRLVATSEE